MKKYTDLYVFMLKKDDNLCVMNYNLSTKKVIICNIDKSNQLFQT